MPDRYRIHSSVSVDQMCDQAPDMVHEMMRRLVRETSPDWSTVRLEISRDQARRLWMLQLEAQAIPRAGGNRG